jgi:AraC-like DNA-binding protein
MKPLKYWNTPDPNPSDAAFRVEGLAVHEDMPPQIINRPNGCNDRWLLMLFYQETEVLTENGLQPCPRYGMVIWTAGMAHRYGCSDRAWDHSWIHPSGHLVGALVGEAGIPVNRVLALSEPQIFEKAIVEIHAEVRRFHPPDPVILRCLFESLVRMLRRAVLPKAADLVIPERLLVIKEHLDNHYAQPLTLADLARRAGLSVPHFSREFRRCFRASPIDYLIRLRMQKAQYLLMDEHRNITEVAAQVGYDNIFYFSRLFKQHFGHSPRELRRTWQRQETIIGRGQAKR